MVYQLTAGGVPVYRDSAGHLYEDQDNADIAALRSEFEASERTFSEYGGGFVDYTDFDYVAGAKTVLAAGVPTQLSRDLGASAANTRLNRPFAGHAFWDNGAKLIRGRALYDIVAISAAIRVVPDQVGGVLRVAIQAGAVEIGGKNMAITAKVGAEEAIRVDFLFPVRSGLLTSGGKVMLTATVPMTINEFSPEFYPLGYEA